MKKFLGVIVALTMCVCLLVPTALAADSTLGDINLGGLTSEELTAILGDMDLGDIDVESLLADIESGDKDALAKLEGILAELGGTTEAPDASAPADGTTGDTGAVEDMLGDLSGVDQDALMGTIEDAFASAGIDLGGFDLGSFDIAGLLGGSGDGSGDIASGATDMVAGIMDTLMGGLEALGFDTAMIEGMLDNEVVNFFANMYIGFSGKVEETTTAAEETTKAPETTKKPVVTTTETPKTGDTSAVFAAIATISVASAAAFVCLKKKEN